MPDNTVCQPYFIVLNALGGCPESNRCEGEEGGHTCLQYDQLTGLVCLVRETQSVKSGTCCFQQRGPDLSAVCMSRTKVTHTKTIYRQSWHFSVWTRRIMPLSKCSSCKMQHLPSPQTRNFELNSNWAKGSILLESILYEFDSKNNNEPKIL